eukprot:Tbor_TRINITY_DN5288_c1_g1::TRINITY_DN5288_c1_g1_i1::g.16343::m.16343
MDDLSRKESDGDSAALIIQKRWREFIVRKRILEDIGNGDNDELFEKKQTKEEIREGLVNHYCSLLSDLDDIKETNLSYQKSLCRFFAEKRGIVSHTADQTIIPSADRRYWDLIKRVKNERLVLESQQETTDASLADIRARHDELIEEMILQERSLKNYIRLKVSEATDTVYIPFGASKAEIAKAQQQQQQQAKQIQQESAASGVVPPRKRTLPKKALEDFEENDDRAQKELRDVRIHYIRLRNKLKKQQRDIDMREKVKAKDLTGNSITNVVDFEQLKIENTNLNEKIEERNEELMKLRKKATTTIHILTHVKEKLEYVRNENSILQREVATMEDSITILRDKLNRNKKERDYFTNENTTMREKMPLVGSEDLLLDYELRKKEIVVYSDTISELKNTHKDLEKWIKNHQPLLDTMKASASLAV